ncbi:MAG: anhydro-N-acetylmuramic acid kinase, partial [Planctomycetes bacterium]|nr:anhydro-N-acetylmuramic acid kinase [Planctomycetota bacterium]
ARLATDFAAAHADALRELVGDDRLDLAAIHGQTVFHAPPLSWQLFTPAPVARALRCPVVHDLRAADLAHGGQGAPITPLADWILFRGDETRAVVNLGGFCNITLLPADNADDAAIERIGGGDVCACNQVLDGIARARLGAPYDENGRAALAAAANPPLVRAFAAMLRAQSTARRSLGTGDELIAPLLAQSASHPAAVVARSACAAIAETIGAACASAGRVVLAGGGVRNQALVVELRARVSGALCASDDLGIPAGFREAAEMAVLGALCQDGVPITLPQITGVPAPAPVAGVWAYA